MNKINTNNDSQKSFKIGFLLLNNFTMLSYANAVEPLRMANHLTGKELFRWYTLSDTGNPVLASEGHSLSADMRLENDLQLDAVIVVGGINVKGNFNQTHIRWLQKQDKKNLLIGGICSGAYVLAAAGLLDGQQCSAHYEWLASINESFPRVTANNKMFSTSKNRLTTSGGVAPMDAMLDLISNQHGKPLSNAIAEIYLIECVRNHHDEQTIPLKHMLGSNNPKLFELVSMMQNNIEEPLSMDELASYIDISRRQLERLFQKHFGYSPSRYYLKLRLNCARQLLRRTSMSIIDIAIASGFVSTTHFSKCYKDHLGVSPRQDRLRSDIVETGVCSLKITSTVDKLEVIKRELASEHRNTSIMDAINEGSYGSMALN